MKEYLIFLIFICCSCSGQPNEVGDWKTERGSNQRTGYLNVNVTKKEPEIKWKKKIAFGSTPVVADGIVYFSDKDSYFYALDIEKNREVWKIKTESPISQAVIDDNGVIYLAERKRIIALDTKTGKQLWEKQYIGSKGALKVQDNLLYIRSYFKSEKGNDHLIALDTKTQKEVWSFSDSSYLGIPTINDEVLYIYSFSQSKFLTLNLQTGKELVEYSVDIELSGGKVLLYDNYIISVLNEKDGSELWRYKLSDNRTIIAISNGLIYIGNRNSGKQTVEIYALDLHTGEVKWTKKYESATLYTLAVVTNDVIIFGINSLKEDLSGWEILYALNPQNGDEIWSKKLDDVLIEPEIIILNNVIMLKAGQMKGLWNSTQDEYDGDYLYLLK